MKSNTIKMKKRRLALIAGIVAGLLAPVAVSSGGVNAAGASYSVSKYYVAGTASPVKGIKVSGWEGQRIYAAITTDQGSLAGVAVTTTTGLTLPFGYAAYSGSSIAFVGTQEAVNAALETLTLTMPASTTSTAVNVQTTFFKETEGFAYNPANQHFYRMIPGIISGTNAFEAAKSQKIFGLTGYLASITSSEENDFVAAKIRDETTAVETGGAKNVWIGASDATKEGDWKWVGSPEADKTFWSGNCKAVDGKAVDGSYAQWATGEPNNWISEAAKNADGTKKVAGTPDNNCGGLDYDPATTALGEDCVVTNWNVRGTLENERVGYWNDLPCSFTRHWTGTPIGGYIVEFGTKTVGSTYDNDVNIRTHTLVKAVPAQKLTFRDLVLKFVNSSKTIVKKGFKIKVLKPKTKTKPAQTITCPPKKMLRLSYTLLFSEAGRYSFYFTNSKGKRLPMQCGTRIKTRVITAPISAPVIQAVKDNEKPVITAYLDPSAINDLVDYPKLNVILKRADGTLVRVDQPNPPLPGMPIR